MAQVCLRVRVERCFSVKVRRFAVIEAARVQAEIKSQYKQQTGNTSQVQIKHKITKHGNMFLYVSKCWELMSASFFSKSHKDNH